MSAEKKSNRANIELGIFEQISLEIDEGFIVDYECKAPVARSWKTGNFSMSYALIFPDSENPNYVQKYFESLLLKEIAKQYGLSNGAACTVPRDDGALYVVKASILIDENIQTYPCLKPVKKGDGRDCASYVVTISLNYFGLGTMYDIINLMANAIGDGIVTSESSPLLKAEFLWAHVEPIRYDNGTVGLEQSSKFLDSKHPIREQNVAWIAGVLTATLILSMIGIFFWKRGRGKIQDSQEEKVEEEKVDREELQRELEEDGRSWFYAPSSSSSLEDQSSVES
eukprot:CAMPEP_0178932102 /NCGR_PEP_ID=MMETSP0786-20121207/22385_1 /TAXON_ID=186022 /ORGANISM="Thalassionema frauenfeldii, Strain CCMP 1798" /LENGTH=282 /DNA_ID=CAMNT_0020609265 /DNA_START=472 /DNA_END=1320 /DNA_ORIENTATION=+